VIASIDEGVPAPVITAALIERFESRGLGEFGDKVLSALRSEFGGHAEKASDNSGRSPAADPTGT
jgi:6-phosphogluconate dehydrogenase